VVIQQNSRKLLLMDILMSETCWAHKKWNKIASDIKLIFYSSTITMMHGPINIRFPFCCYSSEMWFVVVCFEARTSTQPALHSWYLSCGLIFVFLAEHACHQSFFLPRAYVGCVVFHVFVVGWWKGFVLLIVWSVVCSSFVPFILCPWPMMQVCIVSVTDLNHKRWE